MRVLAHRGNRLHAPENTRMALLSAYTAGADVLEFDVQLTRDGKLVVSHDPTTDRVTGQAGRIIDMDLADLRRLDASSTFRPRGVEEFHYRPPGRRRDEIERFPELLDLLPGDVELLIEMKHDSSLDTGRREEFVTATVEALAERALFDRVVLYSKDADNLRLVRKLAPDLRVAAFDWEIDPMAQVQLVRDLGADGLVIEVGDVIGPDGELTEAARALAALYEQGEARVGAVVYLYRSPAVFTEQEWEALSGRPFVWSLATDSMLDVQHLARRSRVVVEASFDGEDIDTDHFAFGYAKANRFCHVYQRDGVHVEIAPYDESTLSLSEDRRVRRLEERMWDALRTWPFYSGGGFGFAPGIVGDFVAEVDYEVDRVGQASMLEMAVVNVQPGAHQRPWERDGSPRVPTSFRQKNIFFDPHGAPPFVGTEHDEDDGYRINCNLGSDYDNNDYGRPVGDGTATGGRLRLERRGPFFSSYYRNEGSGDWVCCGVTRNDSMNPRVFVRCAAKRWRQERNDDPNEYFPVPPLHVVFRNFRLVARG